MARYFLALAIVALVLPATATASRFEAESFSHPTGAVVVSTTTASGGQSVRFDSAATISKTVTLPATDHLGLKARGGAEYLACALAAPQAIVSVDGIPTAAVSVSAQAWTKYRIPVDVSAGSHEVSINALDSASPCPKLRVDFVDAAASATAPWRPFADTSLWNTPASQAGTVTSGNPYGSLFNSYDSGINLGGGPGGSSSHDHDYAKPVFVARVGDPCAPVHLRHPDWVNSNWKITTSCIPVPSGLLAAAGSDGHLTVISADRSTQWSFWRCKQGSDSGPPCSQANVLSSGYQAADGQQIDMTQTSNGLQDCCGSAGGRGSGTPVGPPATVLASEALHGFQHAVGITVPNVSSSYIYPPATKSDGSCGCGIKYGMLFVLRADFPETGSVGRINILRALKTYGAYVVDQGASAEIDTEGDFAPGAQADWLAAGVSRTTLGDLRPATDLWYVSRTP